MPKHQCLNILVRFNLTKLKIPFACFCLLICCYLSCWGRKFWNIIEITQVVLAIFCFFLVAYYLVRFWSKAYIWLSCVSMCVSNSSCIFIRLSMMCHGRTVQCQKGEQNEWRSVKLDPMVLITLVNASTKKTKPIHSLWQFRSPVSAVNRRPGHSLQKWF